MYIDLSNYDDPETALKDFTNEISLYFKEKSLTLERVLGGGMEANLLKLVLHLLR